ncbi:LacI family DNA-binding transcriptional regulator [Priestia megaterium]|jgi:LacI family transcriptional regulator|uniref:LacI family DNA-binding transcriptional regulator n=1 Tax=Priestia megaterium TaxID=1404 RepID=UPI00244C267C|nr:LacI family DNA-binding transcriptional regulator [Priestia megaterium]MDH2363322.1 LacI family DNA-binding transcriptional regulator [Priestia megaterium]
MKPTIYDVAEKAGVSIATVSKVINNTGRISDKTRKKVNLIMNELNYHPSFVASALTGKRTQTIGLLIPNIANPFYSEFARNLEDRAHELGYSIVICSTDYNEEKEKKYVSLLMRKQVDGFIITSGFTNVGLIQEVMDQKIPVALIAYSIPTLSLNSIGIDDYKAGYQATAHLAELGHKRIAVIAETVQSSNDRVRGYKDALKEYQLEFDINLYIETKATVEDGEIATDKLLNVEEPPTAIFAFNDILAIGTMQCAKKRGLSIPENLSVIGCDNTILALIPSLTTMGQPLREMGYEAADILIEEIEGKKTRKHQILLSPELVIRDSTGPLKI